MSPSSEPDVAFGTIPGLGIAAAIADNRPPSLNQTLCQHGFARNFQRNVYLLPTGTDHDTALRAVAAATRQFQEAGWTVAADPRVTIPPATPTEAPSQRTEEQRTARSRAANASSPHRPTKSTTEKPEAGPPTASPPAARRHR
ncbi:hypothetical protein [Streptomyces smyrnaeus]|uniref:hypothetical protein n=1 Tax=Streptomyces smyrnaeus TaxID=1387713 RepID=UPI0036B5F4AA